MEGMIGEVRMFGGNFAPRAWALCDGQLLPINQNTALFSIIGTIYGGDGRTTFALPDCRGRCTIGPGNGPGLSSRREGQKGGSQTNTMTVATMPSHNHNFTVKGSNDFGTALDPTNLTYAEMTGRTTTTPPAGIQGAAYGSTVSGNMSSNAADLANTGGGQSIEGMQPWLAVNFIICLQGVFPSRS